MTRTIAHYTLNTGHCRPSPRSEVADDVIDDLIDRGWTTEGVWPIESLGVRLQIAVDAECLLATLFEGADVRLGFDGPIVTFGVAPEARQGLDEGEGADQCWAALERSYLSWTDAGPIAAADFQAPKRPTETPWLATIVWPAPPRLTYLAADLERCVAWAWIERREREEGV